MSMDVTRRTKSNGPMMDGCIFHHRSFIRLLWRERRKREEQPCTMPHIICVSPCNPNKEFGEQCGIKNCRRSGMFCPLCRDEAIRLRRPENKHLLTAAQHAVLDVAWELHQQKWKENRVVQNRNDKAWCAKDDNGE